MFLDKFFNLLGYYRHSQFHVGGWCICGKWEDDMLCLEDRIGICKECENGCKCECE